MSRLSRLVGRLLHPENLPAGFAGSLDADERVIAAANTARGPLVATQLGLWIPADGAARRVGWHLISKVTWGGGALMLIIAEEVGTAGAAVILRDGPRQRFVLTDAGKLPETVHDRVTGSIKSTHHRELPGGGARFVQRKVPGRDGIVLQVRADPGTDERAVADVAAEVARRAHGSG